MAVIAGGLTHPVLGAGIAGVTAIALTWQRGSAVLAAGSVLALAAAAGYTVVRQWRNDFPPDFGWPQFFEPSHWLAWTALALLGADLVVGALRGRAAGRSVDNSPNSQG
jgi:hypothetical protein